MPVGFALTSSYLTRAGSPPGINCPHTAVLLFPIELHSWTYSFQPHRSLPSFHCGLTTLWWQCCCLHAPTTHWDAADRANAVVATSSWKNTCRPALSAVGTCWTYSSLAAHFLLYPWQSLCSCTYTCFFRRKAAHSTEPWVVMICMLLPIHAQYQCTITAASLALSSLSGFLDSLRPQPVHCISGYHYFTPFPGHFKLLFMFFASFL